MMVNKKTIRLKFLYIVFSDNCTNDTGTSCCLEVQGKLPFVMSEEYSSKETKEKAIMNILYSLENNTNMTMHSKMALYLQTRFFSWRRGTQGAEIVQFTFSKIIGFKPIVQFFLNYQVFVAIFFLLAQRSQLQ